MNLDFVSVHKHAKKELGQYPAILTLHLVNNPYLFFNAACYITQNSTFFDCLFIYVPEKNGFKYPAYFYPLKET